MGVPSQSLPTVGQPNSTEDAKVRSALSELQTILTGNVDASNLAAGAVTFAKLGALGNSRIVAVGAGAGTLAGTVIATTSFTCSGAPVVVFGSAHLLDVNNAARFDFTLSLTYDGATTRKIVYGSAPVINDRASGAGIDLRVPTAGAHTFTITATEGTSGTWQVQEAVLVIIELPGLAVV